MRCSICMATHDKPDYLRRTLTSIFRQPVTDGGGVEVIVVDDRSTGDRNRQVCDAYPVRYIRLDGEPGFRNPAKAHNTAYRTARGEVIIAQSDDVVHISEDCIMHLIEDLSPGRFVIATVLNTDLSGNVVPGNLENPEYNPLTEYTGPNNRRPFFFLGSLRRRDLYAVGGNDEDFVTPGREDAWFADCLMRGLELVPLFSPTIVGHHLQHKHLADGEACQAGHLLYATKRSAAMRGEIPWQASGGPWPYDETLPPSRSTDSLPVCCGGGG